VDKNRAMEYFEKVEKGNKHDRLITGKLTQAQYADEIKAMVGTMHNLRKEAGKHSTLPTLRKFIAGALLRYKEEKEEEVC